MTDSVIVQLGVGGILAILLLREVFGFLKNSRTKNNKGCVTINEFERHKDAVQYKDNCEQIVKRLEGIVNERNVHLSEFGKILSEFTKMMSQIHNELSLIRKCREKQ